MRPGLGDAFSVKSHAVAEMGNSHRDYRRSDCAQRKCLDFNEAPCSALRADIARSAADNRVRSMDLRGNDMAPEWDEIQSVPPIVPEPPFRGGGLIWRALTNRFARWTINRKDKDDGGYLNAMGELYDIGTKYTPKNGVRQ